MGIYGVDYVYRIGSSIVERIHVRFKTSGRHRLNIYGPRREKTCLQWFAKNSGADQPAHPRSLISAFVFRFLESITSKLVTSEVSTF